MQLQSVLITIFLFFSPPSSFSSSLRSYYRFLLLLNLPLLPGAHAMNLHLDSQPRVTRVTQLTCSLGKICIRQVFVDHTYLPTIIVTVINNYCKWEIITTSIVGMTLWYCYYHMITRRPSVHAVCCRKSRGTVSCHKIYGPLK